MSVTPYIKIRHLLRAMILAIIKENPVLELARGRT